MPKKIDLRNLQNEAVEHLLDQHRNGVRWAAVIQPMASGKTLGLQVAMQRLLDAHPDMKGGIIVTPAEVVERSFLLVGDFTLRTPEGKAVTVSLQEDTFVALREAKRGGSSADAFRRLVDEAERGKRVVIVTTHNLIVRLHKEAKELLPGEGWVLGLDETHHSGYDDDTSEAVTNIYSVAETVYEKGGTVWALTATPSRGQRGERLYPEWVEPRSWPYSRAAHPSEANLPKTITVRTLALAGKRADQLLPEDYKTLAKYVKDLDIPTTVRVPQSGNPEVMAGHLLNALVAEGVPENTILNAVGNDLVARKATDRLMSERAICKSKRKGYTHLTLRVLIVCRRFVEGSDWPACGAVVSVGMPTTLTFLAQFLGRATRCKWGITRYPKEWRDRAIMTCFVPDGSWRANHDQARMHLIAGAIECSPVLVEFTSRWTRLVVNFRLPPEAHPRPSYWDRILDAGCPSLDRKVEADLVGARTVGILRKHFGRAPTARELIRKMKEVGSPPAVVQDVIVNLFSESPELHEAALNVLDQSLGEASASGVFALPAKTAVVRYEDILLSRLLDMVEAHPDVTAPLDEKLLKRFPRVTGGSEGTLGLDTLPAYLARLSEVRDSVYDLTDEETIRMIVDPYIREFGTIPQPGQGGVQDVDFLVGYRLSLAEVASTRKRRNLLPLPVLALLHRGYPEAVLGPPLSPESVAKVAKKFASKVDPTMWEGGWPNLERRLRDPRLTTSLDGRRENLVLLAMANRFGWRNLGRPGSAGSAAP